MAGKPPNRLELRRQYDAAEPIDPMEDEAEEAGFEEPDEEAAETKKKKKPAKAPAKARVKAVKVPKPAARVRIVWAVVNDAFKTIATFEYNQKEQAQAKADEMVAKGKGAHFLQKIKEAMPDNAPGIGAVIPRPEPIAPPLPKAVEPGTDEEGPEVEEVDEPEDDDEDDDDEDEVEADDED